MNSPKEKQSRSLIPVINQTIKKGRQYCLLYRLILHREEHIIEPAEDITDARKIGELPTLPIPRGNAGPGLLSHLLISKFVDHLPFYRQAQQFKRQDIDIAESKNSGWFTASCRLLEPLYDRLVTRVRQSSYLMADETPIPVQTHDKPGSTHKGYHWVYYAPVEKLVCFDYRKGRGRDGPEEFLEKFRGMLQVDGYQAYDFYENKEDITLYGCLAHARRKCENSKDNDPQRAEYVLECMRKLYRTSCYPTDRPLLQSLPEKQEASGRTHTYSVDKPEKKHGIQSFKECRCVVVV